MVPMEALKPIKVTHEFREYWDFKHPFPLGAYGFDTNKPDHFAFAHKELGKGIVAALILVPFYKDGKRLCHHVHLCSDWHSKALFKFCASVMDAARKLPEVGYVLCETHNENQYRNVERIAATLGFEPHYVKPFANEPGWVDFVWDSKQSQQ